MGSGHRTAVQRLGRKSAGGVPAFMFSAPLGRHLHAQGETGGDGEENR